MPVTMKGSPNKSPTRAAPDGGLESSDKALGFGAYPHFVPRSKMVFDPVRGGWVQPDAHRAGQERQLPANLVKAMSHSSYMQPAINAPEGMKPFEKRRQPEHFENRHQGEWTLAMQQEQQLGLAPPDWSVSSAMADTRPNGRAMFDARFYGQAMGRARGGYSMVGDARGMEFTAGKLTAAESVDANDFAFDMADETAAGAASAEKNAMGNNTNLDSFDGNALALANMSALQRATDKSRIDFN